MEIFQTEVRHVWDVDGRPLGVRHTIAQEGADVVFSEQWVWNDTQSVKHTDVVRVPLNDAVHILLNMTPTERRRFGEERTTRPKSAWDHITEFLAFPVAPIAVYAVASTFVPILAAWSFFRRGPSSVGMPRPGGGP